MEKQIEEMIKSYKANMSKLPESMRCNSNTLTKIAEVNKTSIEPFFGLKVNLDENIPDDIILIGC